MNYEWKQKSPPDQQVVKSLSESLGISSSLAQLLALRGVQTFEDAKIYFRPDLGMLHDPMLMKDMDKALERIEKAIAENERFMVYGDYDVDGTTAVSIVSSYFSNWHQNYETYIPDRYKEGYGVSSAGIDHANAEGCKLIIALDCGIKALDKIEYAKSKGIDFIICDHHRPGDQLPNAVAVLDPKRADCAYPYKELSGAGVGFKLIQAFHQKKGGAFEDLFQYLDLLCVSIGCDIVPMDGENRVLAHQGLQRLNEKPRKAFQQFIKESGKRAFNITDVVFSIGPRINAAGRIDHGKLAVSLLRSDDASEIKELAAQITTHNNTRKELDRSITTDALQMIEDAGEQGTKSTVLYREDWHKGVIGIVASRLIENYYRPTVVFTKSNGKLAGSARSVKGFDVYKALDECSDILEQFGGHMYAAGMTLNEDRFAEFKEKFEAVVSSSITEEQLIPVIEYDLEVQIADLDDKFNRILKQFAPFGPENMAPAFLTKGLVDSGYTKTVGGDAKHLKLDMLDPSTQVKISGIAFNLGHFQSEVSSGKPFDVIYHLEENEWNGRISKQLRVLDIKMSE